MEQKDIPMPPLPEEEVVDGQESNTIEEKNVQKTGVVEEGNVEKSDITEEQTAQQKNFKALRQEKERAEQERNEAMMRLAEYEKQQTPKEHDNREHDEDLEINIGDDDLFEGKHYKKLQKQLKKQEEALRQYQEQTRAVSAESKLKTKYTDFDKVVSEENIKKLRAEEPEIAEAIASTQDIYSKAVSAYKMIKKLGIYVEDNYGQDRDIAKQNSLKPKPLASVSPQQGDSPLTKANAFANGLTPELKKQLWREMNEASEQY